MALSRARGRGEAFSYWPGFVDALSTMLLTIIFLLSVFMVAQFYLAREVSSKDSYLGQLKKQIADLTSLLSLEKSNKDAALSKVENLSATLASSEDERQHLQGLLDEANTTIKTTTTTSEQALSAEKQISTQALAEVELLNQQIAAMRRQLAALEDALSASESKDKESQARIADLGSKLNVALAQKVQELSRYRSDFFGRLRDILGNQTGFHIVGDRFVFDSEVLFDTGKADLSPAGLAELDPLAKAVQELEHAIPADIPWIIRVDGHTDKRPIAGAYKSNWDLSAARAIAVTQYLSAHGISPQHLAAAAFGEFQPIDTGDSEEALRRNRRIEIKLTER